MPEWLLQVVARTLHMQFQGNWTPVTDIIVDKVGKYAYIIGSPHDTAITPIVMDVTLDVRTKVGHCAFAVQWMTSLALAGWTGSISDSAASFLYIKFLALCQLPRRAYHVKDAGRQACQTSPPQAAY